MSIEKPAITPERIYQMMWGYAPPLMLEAALRHRVFDVLDKGAKTLDEVSTQTGASKRGLRALMNALVGLDFLAKDENGYSLTPESAAFLVSTKPSFQGGLLRHSSQHLIPSWLHLNEVVQTGKPQASVNQEGAGTEFFQEFVADLLPLNYMAAQMLGKVLGVEQAQSPLKVLDIAAGSGVWAIALAQQSTQVRAVAVDWPNVLPITKNIVERFGVAEQFDYIPGDIKSVEFGTGFKVATLGHILHSEGETRSRHLLRKVFDALAPGGTIAIAEMLPNDERTGPPHALIFAVNMLVNTDEGDTFTFAEINSWLHDAGFIDARTLEVPAPSPLILATKPA